MDVGYHRWKIFGWLLFRSFLRLKRHDGVLRSCAERIDEMLLVNLRNLPVGPPVEVEEHIVEGLLECFQLWPVDNLR